MSAGIFFITCGEVDHVRNPLKAGSSSKKSKFLTEIILKWNIEHGYTYQIAQPHHNFCQWKLLTRNEKWKIEKKMNEYSVIFQKFLIANYSKMSQRWKIKTLKGKSLPAARI